MTASVSVSVESRRAWLTMILSGSRSKQTMPTYSVVRSKRTRTSVRSDAGAPSVGSCWVKTSYGAAPFHASSVTAPSMTGVGRPSSSRTADSVGGSAARADPNGAAARSTDTRSARPSVVLNMEAEIVRGNTQAVYPAADADPPEAGADGGEAAGTAPPARNDQV